MSANIKRVFNTKFNLFIVDNDGQLWIIGKNKNLFTKEKKMIDFVPVKINFSLPDNEEILEINYVNKKLSIYTSAKNLYVSKINVPEITNTNLMQISGAPNYQESCTNKDEDYTGLTYAEALKKNIFVSNLQLAERLDDIYSESNVSDSFFCLETNVERVAFINEAIFFEHNNKLCAFINKHKPNAGLFSYGFNTVIKNDLIYYELFGYELYTKMYFAKEFIFLTDGMTQYCVISRCSIYDVIVTIKFRFELKEHMGPLDLSNIIYLKKQRTILLITGAIYIYCHLIKHFLLYEKCFDRILTPDFNSESTTATTCHFGFISDNKICTGDKILCEIPINIVAESILGIYNDNVIFINADISSSFRYEVIGEILFFNVDSLLGYFIKNERIIFCDKDGVFNLDANSRIMKGTELVSKIKINSNITYYISKFNTPQNISAVLFGQCFIVLKVDDDYEYMTYKYSHQDCTCVKCTCYSTVTLELPSTPPSTHAMEPYRIMGQDLFPVSVTSGNKKDANTNIYLIDQNVSSVESMTQILRMTPNDRHFSVRYRISDDVNALGEGVAINFYDDVQNEFHKTYLIDHDHLTEYNLDAFRNMSDRKIESLGRMLCKILVNGNKIFNFRFPLPFINALIKRNPTVSEMEYFTFVENASVFNAMKKYKYSPNIFQELGYFGYADILKKYSHYYNGNDEENELTLRISVNLAKPFEGHIVYDNDSINYHSLDYALSGSYKFNRDMIISGLKIVVSKKASNQNKIRKDVYNLVCSFDDAAMKMFIKNLSGSTIPSSKTYSMFIKNRENITFVTCHQQCYIPIAYCENMDFLQDLLLAECNMSIK